MGIGKIAIDSSTLYDQVWEYFWHHNFGYVNSHFYDITTYSVAFAACIIMFFVKKHIKFKWVNILLVSGLSTLFYILLTTRSERLRIGSYWLYIAFLAPMAYLMVIGMLRGNWVRRLMVYGSVILVYIYNSIYCYVNEDHHKLCYAIKLFVVGWGIAGYVKNIVSDIIAPQVRKLKK